MNKIVLLSDGTGNGAAKRNKTNVWRLYRALDLHRADQLAMYSDGVGSQQFLIFKIIGGVFGWGLQRNVIELYKFLCRNYQHDENDQETDKIYLLGFSRGAFTVRVLAGFIKECGLFTNATSESELHKKARHNYSVYRKSFRRRRRFRPWSQIRAQQQAHTTVRPGIEFIGVWDTVDAYGLPIDELSDLWDRFIFPIRFPDQKLWKRVSRACHAISIDDERLTFHPVLWDERDEDGSDRIEQVWFAGVHADVGGGYPREALSLVSLDWMISKAQASGLSFRNNLRKAHWHRSDWHAPQHDSRAGLAAYYRYKPRVIEDLCNDPNAGGTGVKIAIPKIHRSVFERIKGNVVPYAPTALPVKYEIASTRHRNPKFENPKEKKNRMAAMNGALDIIFWRRCLYYSFLAATISLFTSQYFLDWVAPTTCKTVACSSDPILRIVGDLVPDFISGWIETLRQNPWWLLAFLILFAVLNWLKGRASTESLTRASLAWSVLKRSTQPHPWPPTVTMKLRAITGNKAFRRIRRAWLWTVFALILAVVLLSAAHTFFHLLDTLRLW